MTNFLIDKNITEQERYEYAIKYMADLYDDFHCCLACVKDYEGYSNEYTIEYSKEIGECDNCFTKQVYDYLMKFSPNNVIIPNKVVHAKWESELADNGWKDVSCSNCGFTINVDVHCSVNDNYCSNCGAKMDS